MTIFGDEERYSKEGKGLRGWVIASFPHSKQAEVAGVVFVSQSHPLYVIPMRFFQLSDEEASGMSNSQRNKRTTTIQEGEGVQFRVEDGKYGVEMIWIINEKHAQCPIVTGGSRQPNKLYIETIAVASQGKRSQLYVSNIPRLPDIGQGEVERLRPNVPYVAVFELELSYGSSVEISRRSKRLKIDSFKPSFDLYFSQFDGEVGTKEAEQVVKDAPWNRVTMVSYKNASVIYERGGDEDRYDDGRDAKYFTNEVWDELAELYKDLEW